MVIKPVRLAVPTDGDIYRLNGCFNNYFSAIYFVIFLFWPFIFLAEPESIAPKAEKGQMNLKNQDFFSGSVVELNGDWFFSPVSAVANGQMRPGPVSVPGTWKQRFPDAETGFYTLKILLPQKRPLLSLSLLDISCAHQLWINGELVQSAGFCGLSKESTIPHVKHRIIHLPDKGDTIDLKIQVSGFYDKAPGIVSAIRIGETERLERNFFTEQMAAAILIGAMLLLSVMHLGFSKIKSYHPLFAITIFVYAFHLCFLNHRWMFDLFGPGSWTVNLKLELISLQVFLLFGLLSIEKLVALRQHYLLRSITFVVFFLAFGFVLFTPIELALVFVDAIPYLVIYCSIISISLSLIAKQRKTEYALPVLICNSILVCGVVIDKFTFNLHVDHLLPAHYCMSAYVIFLSFLMLRQTNQAFKKINALSQNLKNLNAELEKQNQNLEDTVRIRTAELTAEQKKLYELELENKNRDLEAISANNKLKQDVSRSIILDLEKISRGKKDVQLAIKQFIQLLKQQFALDEKLNTLQSDTNKVNAEFFERLAQRFPELTKQERELCSLIRLNLSNKDMGILLKTSSNAINVARSRLRKKLGLKHEDDLDLFVQKI